MRYYFINLKFSAIFGPNDFKYAHKQFAHGYHYLHIRAEWIELSMYSTANEKKTQKVDS